MENTQTTEHRSGVYHDDIYTFALVKKRKITHPKKTRIPLTQINRQPPVQNGKNGNDYRDIIIVTNHDPKIMHASGNVVDPGPRNCCNSIRCTDIAQDLSTKRHFVLTYIYVPLAVPEPLVESKSFEENVIKNHGLPYRETPRKDGPNLPELVLRSQISDVDVVGSSEFH